MNDKFNDKISKVYLSEIEERIKEISNLLYLHYRESQDMVFELKTKELEDLLNSYLGFERRFLFKKEKHTVTIGEKEHTGDKYIFINLIVMDTREYKSLSRLFNKLTNHDGILFDIYNHQHYRILPKY